MEQTGYCEGYKPQRWWNRHAFSFVPVLKLHKPMKPVDRFDSGVTRGFTFRWLFIRAWTLEHFALSIEATIDDHWGIGFVGTIAYLRWCFCIPLPHGTFNFLRRKP